MSSTSGSKFQAPDEYGFVHVSSFYFDSEEPGILLLQFTLHYKVSEKAKQGKTHKQ